VPLRLAAVDSGHSSENRVVLDRIREQRGSEPSGVLKTLYYRPEIFGRPFSDALELAMRGESDWMPGERELFAGWVSHLQQCPF
jgi:hypothetical protein